MTNSPKKPVDIAIEDGQRCLKASPVIVLGSGASIPFGLPSMGELACSLSGSELDDSLDGRDKRLWKRFVVELRTKTLENALLALTLSERLSDHVVEHTWKIVNTADTKVFDEVVADANRLPLTRLYRHLFNSTQHKLSVVTTNYDRLAEYAADLAGYCHYIGFGYGYLRRRQTNSRLSFRQGRSAARTIDIWKVHGCLDWFMDSQDQVVAITSAKSIPAGHRPAIVTPGIRKYEQTHSEPFRSIISGADNALTQASAYLCLGFGFNDSHIQPKLMERWRRGDSFLVILTKELSASAKHMLAGANGQEFLALEEAPPTGTRMSSHQHPNGTLLENVSLWRLQDFLAQTT